jgi:hypothetical protein
MTSDESTTTVRGKTITFFRDDEVKRKAIAKTEETINEIDEVVRRLEDRDKGLAVFLSVGGPELVPNRVGDIGYVGRVEVKQIASPTEFHTYVEEKRVAIRGFDTSGIVNGSIVNVGMMFVSGTETYNTAIGGTNTIFVLRKVPLEVLIKNLALPTVSIPAASQEKTLFRIWTDVTGKFKVEAKLLKETDDMAKVVLEKRDGTAIEVPVTNLSAADQAHLRTSARP